MDYFDAVAARHSYREGYTDDPVSREDLEKIVTAGIRAPSGCNAQTTSFVIVDDPTLLGRIAELIDKQVIREAKAVIICVAEHRAAFNDISFAVEDCAAAVENMLLAITALGFASVWLDGVLRSDDRAKKIAELVGVPDDREVRIMLPVGVPAETRTQKERNPFGERAWFNGFNNG